MTTNIRLNGEMYKLENNALYTQNNQGWEEAAQDKYSLSRLSDTQQVLLIDTSAFLVQNGQAKLIEIVPLYLEEKNPQVYFISQRYREEEKYRVVFYRNEGKLRILGRTFEKIDNYLWKIGSGLYTLDKTGNLNFLQTCRNCEITAGRAEVWTGDKNSSDVYIYKRQEKQWVQIGYFPFMTLALH